MEREKVIKGLEFTKAMITFNPLTGEDIEPENLNEENKTTYDACVGAITLLKEQEEKQTPKPIIHGDKEEYWGEEEICPVCGKRWQSANIDSTHFCPGCGQAVIWENT